MKKNHFSRKDFLRLAGLGAVTVAASRVHADRFLTDVSHGITFSAEFAGCGP